MAVLAVIILFGIVIWIDHIINGGPEVKDDE